MRGLGRPPLNDTPTSRKRRAAAAAAQQQAQAAQQLATDFSLASSSSICISEQSSSVEIRPAVTFEPGANNLFADEELDNFVQYMDPESGGESSLEEGGGGGQEVPHNVSFDSQDSRGGGGGGGRVRGFFFGRKRRKKKQQQQQHHQEHSSSSFVPHHNPPQQQLPSSIISPPTTSTTTRAISFPLQQKYRSHSSIPDIIPQSPPPSASSSEDQLQKPPPLASRSRSLQEYQHHPKSASSLLQQPHHKFESFDIDIDTVPVSPRMAPISPFTQDAALQDMDDYDDDNIDDNNNIDDVYFYNDNEDSTAGGENQQQGGLHLLDYLQENRRMMISQNPSWRSSRSSIANSNVDDVEDTDTDIANYSVQAEQASTVMVPYASNSGGGSVEVVERSHYAADAAVGGALLQRQGSWNKRLNRRDIFHRHYVPSRQELDELKDLEDYLGVFSSTSRHRFAALWHFLVPPLDSAVTKRQSLLLQRQSSASSMSSLSSIAQQQQQQQQKNSNQAFYSIVLKRGPIQFEQYQDYHCEWILLTRGFVVARPNFQFIPRFQAGDLWTSVVQVQPTNPLSIVLSCISRGNSISSSPHLSLTQLKQQQQYGCYSYEVSCETPQEQALWLSALRILVINAHEAAATNEKEMGGLGWQYRVVYNPFYTEAVTGNPIQKDKILAGSTGPVDLNALDSYNSYAPLHYATRSNHVRVIRFLLEAGADVHVGDGYGRSPMYYAELHQVPESTIQLLETYGAQRSKEPPGSDGSGTKVSSCQRKLIIIAMILVLLACGVSGLLWKFGMLKELGIGGSNNQVDNSWNGPNFADYDNMTFGSTPSPSAAVSSDVSMSPTVAPIPELVNRGPDTVSPYPTSSPSSYVKTLPPTSVITAAPTVVIRQSPPLTDAPSPSPTTAAPSPSPTLSVFDTDLFKLLEAASFDSGAALRKNSSPQQKAFLWLLKNTNLANYTNDRKIQRYALATLYYSTSGGEWTENLWWLSDEDECMWFTKKSFAAFPVCEISEGSDRRKTMVSLDLSFNNLKGTIPPELGLLSGLLRIDLDGGPSGFLTSSLPSELGQLNLLETFSARGNQLSGSLPAQLGNWAQVRGIDLSFNNLLGQLPATFGSMIWLTELTLEMNEFTGTLPPMAIGQMTNLFKLALGGNQFSGPIPPEIGQLTKLRYLYLELNQFSSLPTTIGRLVNLNVISMFENLLEGSIPSELGNLKKLGTLLLRSNAFTSAIPSELGAMTKLMGALDLSFNRLQGPIPSELGALTSLRSLYLQTNSLQGQIPAEFAQLTHLNTLRVEDNNLVGMVPVDLCDIFSNTYPNFYADCTAEISCSCCTYCCLDGQGCSCQYAGTSNAFLC